MWLLCWTVNLRVRYFASALQASLLRIVVMVKDNIVGCAVFVLLTSQESQMLPTTSRKSRRRLRSAWMLGCTTRIATCENNCQLLKNSSQRREQSQVRLYPPNLSWLLPVLLLRLIRIGTTCERPTLLFRCRLRPWQLNLRSWNLPTRLSLKLKIWPSTISMINWP